MYVHVHTYAHMASTACVTSILKSLIWICGMDMTRRKGYQEVEQHSNILDTSVYLY